MMDSKNDRNMNQMRNPRIYSFRYETKKKTKIYPAHKTGLNTLDTMFMKTVNPDDLVYSA